jgi:hypothetical protein
MRVMTRLGVALTITAAATACSGMKDDKRPGGRTPASAVDSSLRGAASPYDALPDAVRAVLDKPFTGDFDAQVARRLIRVGVTFNRTHYFIDNAWIKKHGEGDAFRNTIERRYLVTGTFAKSATSSAERRKLEAVRDLFKKYGAQYNLDYLLMTAQGYQESTLDQSARNPSGAMGVMQVLPATGKELNVGDIAQVDANIHAGVKYVRFMMDQYYADEPMDQLNKGLMTFAAYNAGPGRIRELRREAARRGLDPNVWFGNVERVASEKIGRETVQYVSNIYKYYVAYKLVAEQMQARDAARATIAPR